MYSRRLQIKCYRQCNGFTHKCKMRSLIFHFNAWYRVSYIVEELKYKKRTFVHNWSRDHAPCIPLCIAGRIGLCNESVHESQGKTQRIKWSRDYFNFNEKLADSSSWQAAGQRFVQQCDANGHFFSFFSLLFRFFFFHSVFLFYRTAPWMWGSTDCVRGACDCMANHSLRDAERSERWAFVMACSPRHVPAARSTPEWPCGSIHLRSWPQTHLLYLNLLWWVCVD